MYFNLFPEKVNNEKAYDRKGVSMLAIAQFESYI